MSEIQTTPPPSARPPYDPALERLRLLSGRGLDALIVVVIAVLAYSKGLGGETAAALLGTLLGAGAVYKNRGGGGGGSGPGGGVTLAAVAGLASLVGLRAGGDA